MRLVPFVTLLACGSIPEVELASPPDSTEHDAHPEVPSILRDVAMVDDDNAFTQPYVPGHRTTMDGRIGVRVQGGPPGPPLLSEMISLHLFVPEALDEPIMTGPRGSAITAGQASVDLLFPPALEEGVVRLGHHAMCDATTPFPVEGERTNPYTCGPDGNHDCYDLTIISSTSRGIGATLWGTPVTVEVAQPKTADATIVHAELGEPVEGYTIPSTTEWTEPAVTMDGRLLTGRLGRIPRSWTNPNTQESFLRPFDLAYAVLPEDAAPCDVTGWTDFHPISHAPYDDQMVGTYGLAAYPFRDSEGNLVADGEDVGGTYPWVDREGANVFMAAVHGRLEEQSHDRFPRRCVHEGCDDHRENIDWDRGFLVAGLWTHGKFVHIDAMINHLDWAVGVTPTAHQWVDLYKDASGQAVPVRVGAGRFIRALRSVAPYPDGYTHNANVLDSLQNLFNHGMHADPITPRDVVWVMSNGVATDEVVFDDMLDPNALILSNMQASVTPIYNDLGWSIAVPKHHNGQVRRFNGPPSGITDYVLSGDEDEAIHLQNGSTSLDWQVPAYGHIDAGRARIEPAALGGIKGRGLWLSGDAAVHYEIPEQSKDIAAVPWYVGLFIDDRAPDELRELLTFPDGTQIRLRGNTVEYLAGDVLVHTVTLTDMPTWRHLAWQMDPGNRTVTLVHNGMAYDRVELDEPMFTLSPGTLTLGARDGWTGIRGWVDDFTVLAHAPDLEVRCNHARGTLTAIDPTIGWTTEHPQWAHNEIGAIAGGDLFACFTDYSTDYGATLANIPQGMRSVREAILSPEGSAEYGHPRPDSSGNGFCLSCHTEEGKGGLSIDALRAIDLPMEEDRRRQPSQPPRRVFGNIPAGWLPGGPERHTQAPPEGLIVDQWLADPEGDSKPRRHGG